MEGLSEDIICSNGCRAVSFLRISPEESATVLRWRNHEDVRKWMYRDHVISEEEHRRFLAGLAGDTRNRYWLVRRGDAYLGVVSLNRMDEVNRNAYLGIYAAPEEGVPGAGRLLIDCLKEIAFRRAGLHTLKLEAIAANERAVGFYLRAGFAVEGTLREFVLKDGGYRDVTVMGMIAPGEER